DIPISKIKYLGGLHVLLELKPYTNSTYISTIKSLLSYFKTLTPWNSDFHLKTRFAWIAIEGLPPQAWHEAAFTRITGEWGEVVFPEECNENNFNLVAGKEPVKYTSKVNDDNASTNKTVNYSNEEDDDHEEIHDGSDYGLLDGEEEHRFLDAKEEHHFKGGWVKDDVVDDGNGENLKFSNVCSKHDDCLNSSIAEEANSKFLIHVESQTPCTGSLQLWNEKDGTFGDFVSETHNGEKSTSNNTFMGNKSVDSPLADACTNVGLINRPSPLHHHNNEVEKTIEVGCAVGFDMDGREKEVQAIIELLMAKMDSLPSMNRLDVLIRGFHDRTFILGDFNEVRFESERLGTLFCKKGAHLFNKFIRNSDLVDLPMGGRRFTRMKNFGTKLSKLDRILVSQHFVSAWPNDILTALPHETSDHCPLILKTHPGDYDPIPFKFFNSWLLDGELTNIVSLSWSNGCGTITLPPSTSHPSVLLKLKLRELKKNIQLWRNKVASKNDLKIRDLKQKVEVLDFKAENGCLDNFDIDNHVSFIKELKDLEHLKNLDLMQKAKIKWAIEDDENSKFFHRYINNKLSRSRINGIFIDDVWVSDPPLVISHIFNFYKSKFEDVSTNRPQFTSNLFKTLSNLDITFLDAPFSNSEIKEAVWNCGGSKAPGPDGFTFNFIKHYWDILSKDFIDMVKKFEMDGYILRGCNPSFIALVPKIQDPLHIKDYRPISLIGCQYKVIAKVLANRFQQVVDLVVSDVQSAYLKGRQIMDGPLMVNEILSWVLGKKNAFFYLKSTLKRRSTRLIGNSLTTE
ncbi:putative RNA-directed DNA polymerase, partial [Tanacetum coccineum]